MYALNPTIEQQCRISALTMGHCGMVGGQMGRVNALSVGPACQDKGEEVQQLGLYGAQ